jgi:16S rRNA C967 or C1407 C5-methylase (RsmB/RsmF family)/NOL1/NOP2/fmu family ribosome biogenesis protein
MYSELTDAEDFIRILNSTPPVSVRKHPLKPLTVFHDEKPVAWCSNGIYLQKRPVFTLDPLFHAGAYYVQEPGSMYLKTVLDSLPISSNKICLDLCAAPGGKSTLLAENLSEDDLLFTNEPIAARNQILRENCMKWGYPNIIVTQNDPDDYVQTGLLFDLILVDAPCSGEGLFRKDPDAVNHWSEDNLQLCEARQNRILNTAFNLLKPGGFLIYSTCTYNRNENSKQIEKLLNDYPCQPVNIPIPEGVYDTGYGLQFYPHRVNSEGFFIACIQKLSSAEISACPTGVTPKNIPRLSVIPTQHPVREIVHISESDRLWIRNSICTLITGSVASVWNNIMGVLKIRMIGTEICELKGTDAVPLQGAAWSVRFNRKYPSIDVNEEQALKYLRKLDPGIDECEKGFYCITYQNLPLGWIKKIPGRVNNYYPAEFRIRM